MLMRASPMIREMKVSKERASDSTSFIRQPWQRSDLSSKEPISSSSTADATNLTTSSTTEISSSVPKSDVPGNALTSMPIRSEHETDKTGVTSTRNPMSALSDAVPTSSKDTSGSDPTPSIGADPFPAPQDTTGLQGADKPTAEPTSTEATRIEETKKEVEDAAKVDTSAAGAESTGLQKGSSVGGTGGNVDAGGFDASKPGATKEAARESAKNVGDGAELTVGIGILETKGSDREAGSTSTTNVDSKQGASEDGSSSGGKLRGLKEKIKSKLHKN